jgi:cis-3-alkyl-4-acyloxetan-2-one decarboxylase
MSKDLDQRASPWPLFEVKHAHGLTQRGWDLPAHATHSSGAPAASPTIVFVHGNPSSKWLWRHLIDAVDGQFRCVAVDHIGMGDSDKPRADQYDFHFEQRVDDLSACLRALKVDGDVILVVHDWGGVIGLRWAQQNPERVAKLVISNTAAFPLMAHKRLPKEIAFVRNTRLGAWVCQYLNGFQRGAIWKGVVNRLSRTAREGYLRAHRNGAECEAIVRFVKDIPIKPTDRGHDKLVSLHQFMPQLANKPVLLPWGLQDFVFDEDYLREFERLLPNAKAIRYPHAGHWLTEDVHAELCAPFVEFVRG